MPRSRSSRGLVVVGDPGDKRAVALDAALVRAGHPPARRIPWTVALGEPERITGAGAPGDVLRIESPGSSVATWHALARRGGFVGTVEHGAWRPGRAWFDGLGAALSAIEAAAPHLVRTHPAAHILAMTDKASCAERLRHAGVPTPDALPVPSSAAELDVLLAERHLGAVFVKARWGSSGAGVLAYRRAGARRRLVTTAVLDGPHIWNDKRLRTYTREADVTRLVDAVIADGAVVERWIPKATVAGGPFDMRVLVIDGRVAQRIARVGRGTITNLHLDATRLDLDVALHRWGAGCRAAVLDACTRAAGCFPGHLAVGVDVMIDAAGRPHVLECNAWGDHLPGLLVDGLDSYDLQVRALSRQAA